MAKSVGMFQRPVGYMSQIIDYSVFEDSSTDPKANEYLKIEIVNTEESSNTLTPDESMLSVTLQHRIDSNNTYYIYFFVYPKKKTDEFGNRTIFNDKYSIYMLNRMKTYQLLEGRVPAGFHEDAVKSKLLFLLESSIAAINENIELINSSAKWERYF